jgi:hypothetical protein
LIGWDQTADNHVMEAWNVIKKVPVLLGNWAASNEHVDIYNTVLERMQRILKYFLFVNKLK